MGRYIRTSPRDLIALEGLTTQQIEELLPENLILLGYRGSVAHGMYVPSADPASIDDKDLMGIFIAPREHYLGFGRQDVRERFIAEWDAVSYEVVKFIRLLLKANPNVLSLLWLAPKSILYENDLGKALREHRHLFVSKLIYHSFTGYANGQLQRMERFNQDVANEMQAYEKEMQLRGMDPTKVKEDTRAAPGMTRALDLSDAELIKRYSGLKRKYEAGYMGEKRRKLVEQLGYDAKNAAHLIRLLRMGIEFLNDGTLRVERPDAAELLSIKRGEWTLEQIKAEAQKLFELSHAAYERSPLPEKPDVQAAENLACGLVEAGLGFAPKLEIPEDLRPE